MAKNILIDTGYWIALFTPADSRHEDAIIYDEYVNLHTQLMPWPSMYEFLNTRFYKDGNAILSFRKRIIQPNVIKIPDDSYRDYALLNFVDNSNWGRRISLVDLVLREILSDLSVNIHAMVTFNSKDFADLCAKRDIEVYDS